MAAERGSGAAGTVRHDPLQGVVHQVGQRGAQRICYPRFLDLGEGAVGVNDLTDEVWLHVNAAVGEAGVRAGQLDQ